MGSGALTAIRSSASAPSLPCRAIRTYTVLAMQMCNHTAIATAGQFPECSRKHENDGRRPPAFIARSPVGMAGRQGIPLSEAGRPGEFHGLDAGLHARGIGVRGRLRATGRGVANLRISRRMLHGSHVARMPCDEGVDPRKGLDGRMHGVPVRTNVNVVVPCNATRRIRRK